MENLSLRDILLCWLLYEDYYIGNVDQRRY